MPRELVVPNSVWNGYFVGTLAGSVDTDSVLDDPQGWSYRLAATTFQGGDPRWLFSPDGANWLRVAIHIVQAGVGMVHLCSREDAALAVAAEAQIRKWDEGFARGFGERFNSSQQLDATSASLSASLPKHLAHWLSSEGAAWLGTVCNILEGSSVSTYPRDTLAMTIDNAVPECAAAVQWEALSPIQVSYYWQPGPNSAPNQRLPT